MRNKNSEWIPLLEPSMPTAMELLPYLISIQENKHYSNFGPLVKNLELEISKIFSLPKENIVTVANATLGIELALKALGLKEKSKILVPSFSFVATATAVVRAGHEPIFCDIDPGSWILTPEIAGNYIKNSSIDAVLAVCTFGMPHKMEEWILFEKKFHIPVVIDAAAGFGSQWLYEGQGTLVFSMHATKNLPAGEGGFVVSNNKDLIDKIRLLSNFGINLDRFSGLPVGALADVGTNAKLSEFHAANALVSLSKWDFHTKKRRILFSNMKSRISRLSLDMGIAWQKDSIEGGIRAPTQFCILMPSRNSRINLEKYCEINKIMTRRWYQPLLSDMDVLGASNNAESMPVAKDVSERLIGLPFFINLTLSQQERVVNAVLLNI